MVIEQEYRERDPGEMATGELWSSLDDDGVDPALSAAMAGPTDTDELFNATLDRLLDAVLPDA